MKLVTICIPTFNQSKSLKKLLNQISKYNPSYPIVISDNGSKDNTHEVVNSFKKKLKNLQYLRLRRNFGFDYNYLKCVKKVKTTYFWTIGSDDQIYKHSLKYIEKIIKNLNYPNGVTFVDKKKILKNDMKKNIINFDVFKHANFLGSISLNIVAKKIFPKNIKIKKNFGYIQLYFIIKSIVKNNNWFLILRNNIAKINSFSLDKTDSNKNLQRLYNEINGYNFHIKKLIKDQDNILKYKELIFKKNIRPWIFQNLETNFKKDKIVEILNKNSNQLSQIYQYKLIKIFITLFPLFLIKKIIYLKRMVFN